MADNPTWYVTRDGEQRGPILHSELLSYASSGELQPSDLVWRAGFTEWQRAADVPGLLTPPAPIASRSRPISAQPPPIPPAPSSAAPTSGENIRYPHLVGVGGWLLWFCICLTIIVPLVVLGQIGLLIDDTRKLSATPGVSNYVGFISIVLVLAAAAGVWVGVCLWKEQPKAHILARHYLLISFVVVTLTPLSIFLFVDIPPSNVGAVISTQVVDTIRAAVATLIWYLYLVKSKRVRATFGPMS